MCPSDEEKLKDILLKVVSEKSKNIKITMHEIKEIPI